MRVLHVTDSYAPTIGGLERAVSTLAHFQADRGDQVAILTSTHPEDGSERQEGNVTVYRRDMLAQKVPGVTSDPLRPFHPTMTDPLFRRGVKEILASFDPNIIHVHGWSEFSVLGPAKKAGIPVVATAHDYGHLCAVKMCIFSDGTVCHVPGTEKCLRHSLQHYGAKGAIISLGLRSSIRGSQGIAWSAISQAVADFGKGSSYWIPGMRVIPTYVPDAALDAINAPERPKWLPEEDYLLFVGGFSPAKGVHVLADAYQRFRASGFTAPLVMLGTRHAETPDLDLAGITVRYNVAHSEVMAAWKYASIGLVPSVVPEPFGLVVVECMAAGTPVIATNHGGIPDIVEDGLQGLLVRPNDASDLAQAMTRLWQDPARRTRMGAAGPARAKRFVISHVINQIDEFYEDAIAENG